MTIQFLYPWNGQDGINSLDSTEESRLVGLGVARYYTPNMDGGPSNSLAALGARVDVFSALTRRQRLLSAPWLLSQWTPSALGGTITGAADMADGGYAGGEIITMTQTTTAGPQNSIETKERIYVPAIGDDSPWFATVELSVAAGQFVLFNATDDVATNLWSVQIGLPDNRIICKCGGGADITVDPAAFSQADWHRITVVVTPSTSTTGTIRYFAHWTSTSTSTEVHQFLGSHDYSTNAVVTRLIVTQSWVALGVVKFTKPVVAEVYGVTNGSSLDAGYVGWCASPKTARTFAPSTYNYRRNPAWLFGQLLFGDGDWFLNHARGGHTVADMSGEFSNFVLALSPKIVSLGSATNSVNNAVALGSDAAAVAQLTADKVLYLSMCQQAIAAGAVVVATGVSPRHDAVAIANLSRWGSYAADWNAWMDSTLRPLGVKVAQPWDALNDAAAPGQLAEWADAGDHVHLSWRAQKTVSELQYKAMIGAA